MDLFGENALIKHERSIDRDSKGRFAKKMIAEADTAKRKAKSYQLMYESERSRNRGFWEMIRQKDEEIIRLRNKLKDYE
ncbi:hypothetical protein [uncultured Bacteroides sp.]|uniref:hypothetical protein n=1 Tax=uncultured Bacteroides sp. TaxID=162156 RepID=UPI002AA77CD8|nr:hypothetical protein [uncultured Bacteroides sp.]